MIFSTRTIRTVVGFLALLALAWSVYEYMAIAELGAPLKTDAAPRGGLSLQLASSPEKASDIRREWASACEEPEPGRRVCKDATARLVLERDSRLILAYALAGVLAAIWAAWVAGRSRGVAAFAVALLIAAGLFDLAENWFLGIQLGNADRLPFARIAAWWPQSCRTFAQDPADRFAHAVTLAGVAAMSKFVCLLVGGLSTVALVGGALRLSRLRREGRPNPDIIAPPKGTPPNFRTLIDRETFGIFLTPEKRSRDYPDLSENRPADEPRVRFRAADVIGLALSGGGIRSATFNLGLLEGLHRLNLLAMFDYVSTVSGGGYVGSFWSEWLARQQQKVAKVAEVGAAKHPPEAQHPPVIPPKWLFPSHRDVGSGPQDRVDRAEERHLREFGAFLVPRWGFFEVETWTALVAVIAGLLPALAIALAIIGVVLVCWLSLTFPLAYRNALAPVPFIVILTSVTLYFFERRRRRRASSMASAAQVPNGRGAAQLYLYIAISVTAVVLVGALQFYVPRFYDAGKPVLLTYPPGALKNAPGKDGFEHWFTIAGIVKAPVEAPPAWVFSPHLFDFALVWLAAALVFVAARLVYPLWPDGFTRESLATYDRVLMRVLGLAVAWCGLALLWHLAINVDSLGASAGAAIVSGGIFATLRNWIGVALRRPKEAGITDRLKPYLPQLLAYLTIVLAAAATGQLLIRVCGEDWLKWWVAGAVMLALMVLALFINPTEFGLHGFYRERISRAYAGACNLTDKQHADQNRSTEPKKGDDRRLAELVGRPLHLVCCAANDLVGDQVETLSRGSRSAVLSKHGFSIGRYWAPVAALQLGSAVTASAAGFNSNMGNVSKQVGPVVSFLMTALNLRLGRWIRHPASASEGHRRWPGLLLYREMLGLTSSSGTVPPDGPVPLLMRDVHLSDGGHFENLALYELIRRHCRYVLVSDCSEDPAVAFDDLGNALRRVREDFGVDISLDVEPLRPKPDGWSRQHVAVGTINYSPTDRGILMYVKPTLTGDEPPDVLQYKTRNKAFPHEGTGDQFYDEAQWESYRRLGLHAAECIFEFVPPAAEPASGSGEVSKTQRVTARPVTADWVFADAKHKWGATPAGLVDRILEMTSRFADLEAALQQRPARGVLVEVFPEIEFLPPAMHAGPKSHVREKAQEPLDEDRKIAAVGSASEVDTGIASDLSCLLRVIQLMEDVWMACGLDEWWDHPLNLGWVNVFARWATAPSFRFWWPLLGPMVSPGFRRFLDERFPTPPPAAARDTKDPDAIHIPQRGQVLPLALADRPPGLARMWWEQRSTQPRNWAEWTDDQTDRRLYQNLLHLPRPEGAPVPMQVGIVAVRMHDNNVGWTSHDFFVPPSLWGARIGWYFLDNLLNELRNEDFTRCYVIVKAPPHDASHEVAMDDRRSFIEQYRKIGFREQLARDPPTGALIDKALTKALAFKPNEDTLLVLDLEQWAKRRGEKDDDASE